MSQIITHQKKAIQAAKNHDWAAAIEHNLALLELKPTDLNALNRLGTSYIHSKQPKLAKEAYQRVLELDRSNQLALKNLARLKQKQSPPKPAFSHHQFIEEPGKTKTVELYRLAGRETLEELSIGQNCLLEPKNRFISVTTEDSTYIGALPEDLSFRLTNLMEDGNTYSCRVKAADSSSCAVFIRELKKSAANAGISSFPNNNKGIVTTTINEVDESMLDENIPVEIISTDTDEEKTLDDLDPSDDDQDEEDD